MLKIALIAVNAKYSQTNLALLYLRAELIEKGIPFDLIEWDINQPSRDLLEMVNSGDYRQALFSVYIWNSAYLQDFIPDLALLNKQLIICAGGPEAVHNSARWLKTPGIDYILDGPAEHFTSQIESMIKPEKPRVLKTNPKAFRETLFPYDKELLEALSGRLVYYEASRGCLFGCSYCLSAVGGSAVEYRKPEQILSELSILRTFTGTVKFVDRTFNANPEISRLVWQYMIENPIAGCFHFEIHPLLLDDEDIKMLCSLPAGSAQLEIGIQSTNEAILKNVNRAGDWNLEKEVIRRLIDTGLFHIHLDQIIGLPGDNPSTAAESLDEIIKLGPENFQLGFLKLLPGTPLIGEKLKWGIKHTSAAPYEILESSTFSFTDLQHFHRIEKLISRVYNSHFFQLTLESLAEKCGSWYNLFASILSEDDPDLNCKRWEYWGRILMNYIERHLPKRKPSYIDLLRVDWCPFATGQYYADFLRYPDGNKITEIRAAAIRKIRIDHPEFGKSVLNRAILFIPEHPELSDTKAAVFFTNNRIKEKIFI